MKMEYKIKAVLSNIYTSNRYNIVITEYEDVKTIRVIADGFTICYHNIKDGVGSSKYILEPRYMYTVAKMIEQLEEDYNYDLFIYGFNDYNCIDLTIEFKCNCVYNYTPMGIDVQFKKLINTC